MIHLLLVLSLLAAPQGPHRIVLDSFTVEMRVDAEGHWEVTERLALRPREGTLSFGARELGSRVVGLRAESPDLEGFTHDVDGRTVSWTHTPSEGGTVILHYRVEGELLDRGDRNEILWAAMGRENELPIQRLEARVHLPAHFADTVDDFELDPEGDITGDWTIRFAASDLEPGEAYEFRVSFPWSVEGRTPIPHGPIALASILLLVVGLGVGLLGYRRTTEVPPTTHRLPPEEAALLLFSGPGAERAFQAVLLKLARRGHLTLGEELRIHRDPEDPLSSFEAEVLDVVEDHEGSMERFMAEAGGFRRDRLRSLRIELAERGLLVDRRESARGERRRGYVILTVAVLLPVAVLWTSPWVIVLSAASLGLALGLLVRGEQRFYRSREGEGVRAAVLAHLETLRAEIRDAEPMEGARRYLEALPWLLLDRERPQLEREVTKGLGGEGGELPLPEWLEVDGDDPAATFTSATQVAVFMGATTVPTTVTPTMGAPGGGGVSAG